MSNSGISPRSFIVLFILALGVSAIGQTITGMIVGSVTDPSEWPSPERMSH